MIESIDILTSKKNISDKDLELVNKIRNKLKEKGNEKDKIYVLEKLKEIHNFRKTSFNFQHVIMFDCKVETLVCYFKNKNYRALLAGEYYCNVFVDCLSDAKKYELIKTLIQDVSTGLKNKLYAKEFAFNLYDNLLKGLEQLNSDKEELSEIFKSIDFIYYENSILVDFKNPLLFKKTIGSFIINKILKLYNEENQLYKKIIKTMMNININIKENSIITDLDLEQLIKYLKNFVYNETLLNNMGYKIQKKYSFNGIEKYDYILQSDCIKKKQLKLIRRYLIRIKDNNNPIYIKKTYNIDIEKDITKSFDKIKNYTKKIKEKYLLYNILSKNSNKSLNSIINYYNNKRENNYLILKRFKKIIEEINEEKDIHNKYKLLDKINELSNVNDDYNTLVYYIKKIKKSIIIDYFNYKINKNINNESRIFNSKLYLLLKEEEKIDLLKNLKFNSVLSFLYLISKIKSNDRNILLKDLNNKKLNKEIFDFIEQELTIKSDKNNKDLNIEKSRLMEIFSDSYIEEINDLKNNILKEPNSTKDLNLHKLSLNIHYFNVYYAIEYKSYDLRNILYSINNILSNNKKEIIDIGLLFKNDNDEKIKELFDFINSNFSKEKKKLLIFSLKSIMDIKLLDFEEIYILFKFLRYDKQKIEKELILLTNY